MQYRFYLHCTIIQSPSYCFFLNPFYIDSTLNESSQPRSYVTVSHGCQSLSLTQTRGVIVLVYALHSSNSLIELIYSFLKWRERNRGKIKTKFSLETYMFFFFNLNQIPAIIYTSNLKRIHSKKRKEKKKKPHALPSDNERQCNVYLNSEWIIPFVAVRSLTHAIRQNTFKE